MINEVHRGVTALQSVGWYSQKESKVLLIVSRKQQMNEVVSDIKAIDKKAFVQVSTAMSVFGEGFEEIKTGIKVKKTIKTKYLLACDILKIIQNFKCLILFKSKD